VAVCAHDDVLGWVALADFLGPSGVCLLVSHARHLIARVFERGELTMSDGLKSHIRTWWPIAIGFLAALLVDTIAQRFGIHIDSEIAFGITAAVTTALLYSLGRWLETRRWAPARALGAFILSLGLVAEKPTYPPTVPAGTVRPLKRHEL
jgi:hypothetical protein